MRGVQRAHGGGNPTLEVLRSPREHDRSPSPACCQCDRRVSHIGVTRWSGRPPVTSTRAMPTDAAITSFAIVFTVFLVVTVILLVLVLRFILQRAAIARTAWLSEQTEEEEDDRPITALVLAGGGIRGAVQIGMLQVLAEHGFVPDRIYGSSVGAINGAAFAGDPTRQGVERMTEIWMGLTRDRVYPQGRLHGPWLYFQQRDSVYANSGLAQGGRRRHQLRAPRGCGGTRGGGGDITHRWPGALVHVRAGGRVRAGIGGHSRHLPAGGNRRRPVHRRGRGRQRADPPGHRGGCHPYRRVAVHPAHVSPHAHQAAGGGPTQRPLHLGPQPVRSRHDPATPRRRGHRVQWQRVRDT